MANDDYRPSNTILCFEKFKEASLYFDRVLPLNMGRMRGDSTVGDILVGYPEEVPSAALSHLIDGVASRVDDALFIHHCTLKLVDG